MIPTLGIVDVRLQTIAEGGEWMPELPSDMALEMVGFVRDGALTEAGKDYYIARIVAHDDEATAAALAALLREDVVVNTFCGYLWPHQKVPRAGAISLVKRLRRDADEDLAVLWLDLMSLARMIAYEKSGYGQGDVRILYDPTVRSSSTDDAERERVRGHVLNPRKS